MGLPGSDGSMSIMDRHAADYHVADGDVGAYRREEERFAVKSGAVEVLNNVVTVLCVTQTNEMQGSTTPVGPFLFMVVQFAFEDGVRTVNLFRGKRPDHLVRKRLGRGS